MYRLVGIALETKPRRDLDPWEVDGAGFGVASDEDDSQIMISRSSSVAPMGS